MQSHILLASIYIFGKYKHSVYFRECCRDVVVLLATLTNKGTLVLLCASLIGVFPSIIIAEVAKTEACTLLLNELRDINSKRKLPAFYWIDLLTPFAQKDIDGNHPYQLPPPPLTKHHVFLSQRCLTKRKTLAQKVGPS